MMLKLRNGATTLYLNSVHTIQVTKGKVLIETDKRQSITATIVNSYSAEGGGMEVKKDDLYTFVGEYDD